MKAAGENRHGHRTAIARTTSHKLKIFLAGDLSIRVDSAVLPARFGLAVGPAPGATLRAA
jgi:hypothetical protein